MLSTVTDKGQVTLPKSLRDRLGIRPGMKVEFALQPDETLRLRVLARGSTNLFGLLAVPGEGARAPAQIDAGITAAVSARSRRR
jgi:AbrB family looped-hinge helix DNA binding protein